MDKSKVCIIGEIGINHNGNVELALELIGIAAKAGFDYVKFQKRDPELYPERPYNSPLFGETTYREHKRKLELSYSDYCEIAERCEYKGIKWFASTFDIASVDFMKQFYPDMWKIPSPCLTDLELVKYIAKQDGFLLISTGMSTEQERNNAIYEAVKYKTYDYIAIMHCCSEYPTPLEHVNLNVITQWNSVYPCRIGYSSHDAGVPCSVAAVGMGAMFIEVHITLNRAMKGSDHAASLEYEEMERLVRHIRGVEKALGSYDKPFYEGEMAIRRKVEQNAKNSN